VDIFAAGINNSSGTGGNLPLVSLIPIVHLDSQISSRIFEKFEMTLLLCPGACGKMIHEKNLKQKTS
jgi:hypothetical protein